MKGITQSMNEILAAVCRCAATHSTGVNALVREFLVNLAGRQGRSRSARAQLRRLSKWSPGQLGNKTWTRDDLHAR